MSVLQVRAANLADRADRALLVRLTDGYASDPMGGGAGLSSHARLHLADALGRHPGLFAVIAELDGEPVGHALCVLGFSSFYAAPVCNLHDLSVLAAGRGKGLGRLLMQAVEDGARSRGCAKVTLEVREDNHIGLGLYHSEGFAHSGLGDARYLMMEKKL
ncbi:GNAT family N-acetyltransferase [Vogesella sp. LIG4]|uniref:GNAT family N-acetyltransferase n=1 Tax=Vogesella sp. LIG4 TaxID=1192162 RepID=UPI00081F7E49|nr:GNAT family N-acetyltransferase [Vogesella sp. LIG4]SCK13159.1 Acetyltransferases [Vogesella sp. LIG4]